MSLNKVEASNVAQFVYQHPFPTTIISADTILSLSPRAKALSEYRQPSLLSRLRL